MTDPSTIFSILSDPTRLRIMMLLAQEGDLCVCEIMYALDVSQPKVSRHLANMRKNNLVFSHREGTWKHYQINPALPKWSKNIISQTSMQLCDHNVYKKDMKKLRKMNNRPGVKCA